MTTRTNGMTLAEACAMVIGAEKAAVALTAWMGRLAGDNVLATGFVTGLEAQIATLTAATAAA